MLYQAGFLSITHFLFRYAAQFNGRARKQSTGFHFNQLLAVSTAAWPRKWWLRSLIHVEKKASKTPLLLGPKLESWPLYPLAGSSEAIRPKMVWSERTANLEMPYLPPTLFLGTLGELPYLIIYNIFGQIEANMKDYEGMYIFIFLYIIIHHLYRHKYFVNVNNRINFPEIS